MRQEYFGLSSSGLGCCHSFMWAADGIGRHRGLRNRGRKALGFESLAAHQKFSKALSFKWIGYALLRRQFRFDPEWGFQFVRTSVGGAAITPDALLRREK